MPMSLRENEVNEVNEAISETACLFGEKIQAVFFFFRVSAFPSQTSKKKVVLVRTIAAPEATLK